MDFSSQFVCWCWGVLFPPHPQIQNVSRFGQCPSPQTKCYFQPRELPCFASSAQTGNHPVWEDSLRSQRAHTLRCKTLTAPSHVPVSHQASLENKQSLFPQRMDTILYIYMYTYVYVCAYMYACVYKYRESGSKRYFTNPAAPRQVDHLWISTGNI